VSKISGYFKNRHDILAQGTLTGNRTITAA